MKIAPIDIAHKSFARKMMGFDANEVSEFLRAVSEEMEALTKERNQLRESLRDKELQILEYRERDKLLKETITTAQKMSDRIKEEAEREAKLILHDANQKADHITRDARDSLKRVYKEITDYQKIRIQFETQIRSVVSSHVMLIDQQEKVYPKNKFTGIDGVTIIENQESTNNSSKKEPSP